MQILAFSEKPGQNHFYYKHDFFFSVITEWLWEIDRREVAYKAQFFSWEDFLSLNPSGVDSKTISHVTERVHNQLTGIPIPGWVPVYVVCLLIWDGCLYRDDTGTGCRVMWWAERDGVCRACSPPTIWSDEDEEEVSVSRVQQTLSKRVAPCRVDCHWGH